MSSSLKEAVMAQGTINLQEVGAHPTVKANGDLEVKFGLYLPNITAAKGYEVVVRLIHRTDRFTPEIPPKNFPLICDDAHPYDLWQTTINLTQQRDSSSSFGKSGTYFYRYQLSKNGQLLTLWFTDPFAYETGTGELSAFTTSDVDPPFEWTDDAFKVPVLDDMVVYEMQVEEFNDNFEGVIDRLDYLQGLGVNVLELMPITSMRQEFDWGYGPLHFWAPEERYGSRSSFKRMVNACHEKGIAVILDSVYEHVDDAFAYNRVYADSNELKLSPMIGPFGEGSFGTQINFDTPFTQQFFLECNRYWMSEYHVDGFRYDYVPGFYDGPTGKGYAKLVFDTYQDSLAIARFQDPLGYSRIIQCAEHLPDPRGILSNTFSNSAWQNDLLNKVENMAQFRFVDESFVHLLDTRFSGYPDTREVNTREANSVIKMPVAPFQYFETHDHSRLITRFGLLPPLRPEGDIQFGDRRNFFKLQPLAIALYTCQGIPMLWQGQEFAENYTLPEGGNARISVRRSVHWEYFYDQAGLALVRLYRKLAQLRKTFPALRSRKSFYFNQQSRPRDGIVAYQRSADATATAAEQVALVLLNFADEPREILIPFAKTGVFQEMIDGTDEIVVAASGELHKVVVPSNYGRIYLH
jgi:maltooligosyltrehalose trehalohydrolase